MEDDQQFCLRWNNHQSTLIQNFDTLLESGTLVDCTLAAEGKYLKAHKVVLSACSPYFEGLLSEHYDKHPVFILKDVKFKELKAMMDYMYRGEVNINQDQLTALLKAAESLQIKGLSDSRTGGGPSSGVATTAKTETRPAKTASSAVAASSSHDIPHASSGLTIEKNNKVPRQSLQQVSISDLPDDSASPHLRGLSSREGSQSPTRKRKRLRRRSLGNDDTNSMENHEASNSSDVNISAPALGVAPVAEDRTHADPADTVGRSALMQQLTKPADEMLQIPIEKPEPSDELIQPKSEYLDDQESVEELTNLDDDMNDLNDMDPDNSRAGPSHDPSQHGGLAAWHIAGDRSNASVVGAAAGAPGQQDEVFLAAQDAAQAQRDSQDVDLESKPFLKIHAIRSLCSTSEDFYDFTESETSEISVKDKSKSDDYYESDEIEIDNDDDNYKDDDNDDDNDDDSYAAQLQPFALNFSNVTNSKGPILVSKEEIEALINKANKKEGNRQLICMYCKPCSKTYPQPNKGLFRPHYCPGCNTLLQYRCVRCPDKVYMSLQSATRHVQGECVDPRTLRCPFCDYQTARKYRLVGHVERRHRTGINGNPIVKTGSVVWKRRKTCPSCGNKFKTLVRYERHVKNCAGRA